MWPNCHNSQTENKESASKGLSARFSLGSVSSFLCSLDLRADLFACMCAFYFFVFLTAVKGQQESEHIRPGGYIGILLPARSHFLTVVWGASRAQVPRRLDLTIRQ